MSTFGFIKNRVAQYNQLAIQWRWNPRLIMWSAMTSTRHIRPRLIMAENCLGKWMVALCDHLPEGRKEHIEKGVFWTLWFWQPMNFATSKLFVKNKATGTPLDRCMLICASLMTYSHNCTQLSVRVIAYIPLVGLSALLVSTNRAMRRPIGCGTSNRSWLHAWARITFCCYWLSTCCRCAFDALAS